MVISYTATALLLFLVHVLLKDKYGNTLTRCAVWAVLWPLDVAIALHDGLRYISREGGAVDSAALILKMREGR